MTRLIGQRLARSRQPRNATKDRQKTRPIGLAPKPSNEIYPPTVGIMGHQRSFEAHPSVGDNHQADDSSLIRQSSSDGSSSTASLDADNYYFTIPGFSLCAALHRNAQLQGISCLLPLPLMTPPGTPSLPLPLHPTPLQMTTIHLPYIDCLPIPKLRYNLILLNGLVDEEEFCADLVGTTSFVVLGRQSWDPEGWVLEREFKEKWRFLFD
jgi:hypothetical protein